MKNILLVIILCGFVMLGCENTEIDTKLTNNDFIVEYNGFIISEDTTVESLVENLGFGNEEDYYYNNDGYISTIEDTQIFGLY